mgnify:CR=1 FL=1
MEELEKCADQRIAWNRVEWEREHGQLEDLGDCDDSYLRALADEAEARRQAFE